MSGTARIAALFVEAHRCKCRFPSHAAPVLDSVEDVYRVQNEVLAALSPGARAAAWKVSPPRAGADPTAAPIPPARCHHSPARLAAADFHMLGIEVEIAFRMGRDLPLRSAPYAAEEVFAAVDAALIAIEVCDTRLADWEDAPPLWRLADFQSNGALILGSAVPAWRGVDFKAQAAQLWVDGRLVVEASGSHPVGEPWRLLPWTAAHVARRGGGLHQGDVVTTGTWTGMHRARPGDEIEARFPGLGEARLTISA